MPSSFNFFSFGNLRYPTKLRHKESYPVTHRGADSTCQNTVQEINTLKRHPQRTVIPSICFLTENK